MVVLRERGGQLKTSLRSRINRVWCQIECGGERVGEGFRVLGDRRPLIPVCSTGRRIALWEGSIEFRFRQSEFEEKTSVSMLGERSGQEMEI